MLSIRRFEVRRVKWLLRLFLFLEGVSRISLDSNIKPGIVILDIGLEIHWNSKKKKDRRRDAKRLKQLSRRINYSSNCNCIELHCI